MPNETVSIIIPVFNGADYIGDAIDSAIAQTYPNIEIIVVNDGSTDNTEELCLQYGERIRYIPKENGGVSTALNLGVRKMRGDYFTWLAHDDMFYPEKIALQVMALKQSGHNKAIVHGNYDLLNMTDNSISLMRQDDSYTPAQLENSVFPLLMTTLHASAVLIHKSHFERVGLFDESQRLTQDYDLLFKMMRGQRTIFVPQPLLLSRLHGQSGKNVNSDFGRACSEQYKSFVDNLTFNEVCEMFESPRAFYCRMAAMMKARAETVSAEEVFARVFDLPDEGASGDNLNAVIRDLSGGVMRKICVFGAGYHGKVIAFELQKRGIIVNCFCDNDQLKHGTIIAGIPCISVTELEQRKKDFLVIAASDLSDAIVSKLKGMSFPFVTRKQYLDAAILNQTVGCLVINGV